jgi:hypothetical protein
MFESKAMHGEELHQLYLQSSITGLKLVAYCYSSMDSVANYNALHSVKSCCTYYTERFGVQIVMCLNVPLINNVEN